MVPVKQSRGERVTTRLIAQNDFFLRQHQNRRGQIMKRTTTVSKLAHMTMLIAILLTASAHAVPEKRNSLRQAKPQSIDLRPAMKRMKLKEGSNVIGSGRGVKLIAEVKDGKVVEWRATSSTGTTIPMKARTTRPRGKRLPCIVCPIDSSSAPLDMPCYEIDCSKLPKPTVKQL